MNQLALFEDNTVSYMLPYMRDEFPMNPQVAEFLESRPDWNTILQLQDWMARNGCGNSSEYGINDPDSYFWNGLYMRSFKLDGGQFAVGKMIKEDFITIIPYGDMTVITKDSQERIRGPRVLLNQAGTQRAAYAHADSMWITIHRTNATTVEEAERELIVPQSLLLEENTL